jgi:hypothetical protein
VLDALVARRIRKEATATPSPPDAAPPPEMASPTGLVHERGRDERLYWTAGLAIVAACTFAWTLISG